jgi:hypothetical protein
MSYRAINPAVAPATITWDLEPWILSVVLLTSQQLKQTSSFKCPLLGDMHLSIPSLTRFLFWSQLCPPNKSLMEVGRGGPTGEHRRSCSLQQPSLGTTTPRPIFSPTAPRANRHAHQKTERKETAFCLIMNALFWPICTTPLHLLSRHYTT